MNRIDKRTLFKPSAGGRDKLRTLSHLFRGSALAGYLIDYAANCGTQLRDETAFLDAETGGFPICEVSPHHARVSYSRNRPPIHLIHEFRHIERAKTAFATPGMEPDGVYDAAFRRFCLRTAVEEFDATYCKWAVQNEYDQREPLSLEIALEWFMQNNFHNWMKIREKDDLRGTSLFPKTRALPPELRCRLFALAADMEDGADLRLKARIKNGDIWVLPVSPSEKESEIAFLEDMMSFYCRFPDGRNYLLDGKEGPVRRDFLEKTHGIILTKDRADYAVFLEMKLRRNAVISGVMQKLSVV